MSCRFRQKHTLLHPWQSLHERNQSKCIVLNLERAGIKEDDPDQSEMGVAPRSLATSKDFLHFFGVQYREVAVIAKVLKDVLELSIHEAIYDLLPKALQESIWNSTEAEYVRTVKLLHYIATHPNPHLTPALLTCISREPSIEYILAEDWSGK
jgi:hypothetical protein